MSRLHLLGVFAAFYLGACSATPTPHAQPAPTRSSTIASTQPAAIRPAIGAGTKPAAARPTIIVSTPPVAARQIIIVSTQPAATRPTARASTRPATTPKTLSVGMAPPPFIVDQWIKGEPIQHLEKGRFYAVEFWSSTCSMSKNAIPLLSKVQKAYPELVLVGVEIRRWQHVEKSEKLVKEMGEQMGYRVAVGDTFMRANWLAAMGERGVPWVFIVNPDSKIVWFGRPDSAFIKAMAKHVGPPAFDLSTDKEKKAGSVASPRWSDLLSDWAARMMAPAEVSATEHKPPQDLPADKAAAE